MKAKGPVSLVVNVILLSIVMGLFSLLPVFLSILSKWALALLATIGINIEENRAVETERTGRPIKMLKDVSSSWQRL